MGIVHLGNTVWRELTHIAGLEIPDDESPPPADQVCMFMACVGRTVNASEPDVTETRVETISEMINEVFVTPYGAFPATDSQAHGRFGTAKLGLIK